MALAVAIIASCQNAVDRDNELLKKDPAAMALIQAVQRDLQTQKIVTPENYDKLKELREKYPASTDVKNLYRIALADREDWQTLEELLTATSSSEQNREDQILLAKVLLKRRKYAEGLEMLRQLGLASSSDVEIRSMSALANFHLGRLDEAEADLDAVWDTIISQKRVADVNLKGMIQFQRKEYEQAKATFERSLTIDPNEVVANNMLSRTYATLGDPEMAEKHRGLSESSRRSATLKETNQMRFVSLSKKLTAAWDAKQYHEVLDLTAQMMPIADGPNKAVVLRYVAESHKALGDQAAADAATQELNKLRSK